MFMLQLFNQITPPGDVNIPENPQDGVIMLLNFILRLVFVIAGLYALFNFVQAGFAFLGSGGDSKQIEAGRDKIMWTIVGILLMASAVAIAGLIGIIVYKDWNAIITPDFTRTP
jgi:hypothetical protein